MLTIRPTKMLAKRLGISLPKVPPVVTNRVADWCVHEFRFSRHRYLIFCNTASLYSLVTYARGVTDGQTLVERLTEALRLNLTGNELGAQYRRWIEPELGELQWAPVPGFSFLGSMGDMINMAKYDLEYRDNSLVETSRRLARSPMSMLGMNSPDRVFPKLRG